MSETFRTAALDERAWAELATTGLRLALVDADDPAALDAWLTADLRGFHAKKPSPELLEEARGYLAERRITAVYDDPLSTPIGTGSSWVAPLTLPGGQRLDAWAISSVTVAPTHRRRGLAAALIGSELRTAHRLGLPVAILTVSESVIYGRWGFGPATFASEWRIDAKRVCWAGGDTSGRLTFTEPDEYRETGQAVLDRVMAGRPGEIGLSAHRADRLIGPLAGCHEPGLWRLVRYDSPTGEPEGFVSFVVKETDDFVRHTVEVRYLAATTDAALTALWRFLLELDLVGEVTAHTRGVDEPLHALVSDIRGARVTGITDHLWVRILDVPAALTARRYERDGDLTLDVTDDLGFAAGRYRLTVQDGAAQVERAEAAQNAHREDADVTLPVAALSSVFLGHDTARGLALAGGVTGDAGALDRLFRTAAPPRLSTWF